MERKINLFVANFGKYTFLCNAISIFISIHDTGEKSYYILFSLAVAVVAGCEVWIDRIKSKK